MTLKFGRQVLAGKLYINYHFLLRFLGEKLLYKIADVQAVVHVPNYPSLKTQYLWNTIL